MITVSEDAITDTEPLRMPFDHPHMSTMKTKSKCQPRSRSTSLRKLNDVLSQCVDQINDSKSAFDRLTAFTELEKHLDAWTAGNTVKAFREAVFILECATRNTNDETNTSFQEFCIAKILVESYRREGIVEDLTTAVNRLERAIEIPFASRPEKPIYLLALGTTLNIIFERFNIPKDLKNAIKHLEAALQLSPATHPLRTKIAHTLSSSFVRHFALTKASEDITRALNLQEDVVSQSSTATHLRIFSDLFITRLTAFPTSYPNDIDRAIHLATESVELSKDNDSPEIQAACLNSLGGALAAKAVLYRDPSTDLLRKIIQTNEDAVTVCPLNSLLRHRYFKDLASALVLHFRTTKEEKSLDRAIDVLFLAAKCQFEKMEDRVEALSRLANALILRFKSSGNVKDLNKAIESAEKAVESCRNLNGGKLQLQIRGLRELGLAIYTRHLKTKVKGDLDRAIVIFGCAIALLRENDDAGDSLGLVGFLESALRDRFEMSNGEVESEIEEMRKVVKRHAKGIDGQLVLGIIVRSMPKSREGTGHACQEGGGINPSSVVDNASGSTG